MVFSIFSTLLPVYASAFFMIALVIICFSFPLPHLSDIILRDRSETARSPTFA
jgi:hypothetical protein